MIIDLLIHNTKHLMDGINFSNIIEDRVAL